MANESRWIDIGEGCRRDPILYTRLDGSQFYREWSPWLGSANHYDAPALAASCKLIGGGWSFSADPAVFLTTINYSRYSPAMHPDIADGNPEGWAWTAQVDPSDSFFAFVVILGCGRVGWRNRGRSGLVRGYREVPIT